MRNSYRLQILKYCVEYTKELEELKHTDGLYIGTLFFNFIDVNNLKSKENKILPIYKDLLEENFFRTYRDDMVEVVDIDVPAIKKYLRNKKINNILKN